MNIHFYSFGKLKIAGLREVMDYYLGKISSYEKVQEIELKALEVPDKSLSTQTKIQKTETNHLLEKISKNTSTKREIILLDEKGKTLTSPEWARLLRSFQDHGCTDLIFCIGSSLGFGSEIKSQADLLLNLGAHTLPHELARVVCAEQVFRALTILKGHPYHNG